MIAFIDEHRAVHGVAPICKVLPIAPSTYHAHVARRADRAKAPPRALRGAELSRHVRRLFEELRRLRRAQGVAPVRLRRGHGGTLHGGAADERDRTAGHRPGKRTTISDKAAPCPLDRVNRDFKAERPNALWVADFTYVATWMGSSMSPS